MPLGDVVGIRQNNTCATPPVVTEWYVGDAIPATMFSPLCN